MPVETLHLEEGSATGQYGAMIAPYGALPRLEEEQRVQKQVSKKAVASLALVCACFVTAAVLHLSGPSVPQYIVDLQADGHQCLNWVSYCKEHQICLSKFHVRTGNEPEVSPAYAVAQDKCPEYLDDCKLFCNECDCPDDYCEAVFECCNDNCKVITDGLGSANKDTNPPTVADPPKTYGECEWTSSGDGFYKQNNRIYPACPDEYVLFSVEDGGFCCKGACTAGSEWTENEGLCALESNENPQGAPYCAGYNDKQFCKITFGEATWTDYKYELEVSFRGEMAGAVFRVESPGDPASKHYMYAMNKNGTYMMRHTDAYTAESIGESQTNVPCEDITYSLSIDLQGPQIKLYRNGDLEMDIEEPADSAILGGGVGLVSYKAQLSAFNLRVLDLEDVSMIGYISVYLTAPNYVTGVYVDGDRLAYPSTFNTNLAETVPFDIIGDYKRLAVQIRGLPVSEKKCVDEPPYGEISIAELNACLQTNDSTAEIEFIDLGEDETKEDATVPKWVPYDALHERVMDDQAGSVMDQMCNVFGYEKFDLASTVAQSDALLNDEDETSVYPSANGKYDCFCGTLDPDCFDEGGLWSDDMCSCDPDEYADFIGVFPNKGCKAPVTTGKQYLSFFCSGGAGNTAQFNGWAAAFIASTTAVDAGGLKYTVGGDTGWKCASAIVYDTDSQWYTPAFDVSAWAPATEVATDYPLPDNIASANSGDGANAKFLWVEDQKAKTVYCVYDAVRA